MFFFTKIRNFIIYYAVFQVVILNYYLSLHMEL